jgi:hypothetical protein
VAISCGLGIWRPFPRVIARSAATWQSLADIGGQAVPKALPSAPPGQEDDQSHEIGRGVVDQRHLPSVSLSMVDLMRSTMMRSVTSLPPVISVPATYGFTAVQSPFGRCSAKAGRRRGWQSRRWRRNIVNLTIFYAGANGAISMLLRRYCKAARARSRPLVPRDRLWPGDLMRSPTASS